MSNSCSRLPTLENNSSVKGTFRLDIFSYTQNNKFFKCQPKPPRQKSQYVLKKQEVKQTQQARHISANKSMECVEVKGETAQDRQIKELVASLNMQLTSLTTTQKQEIERLNIQIKTLQFFQAERNRSQLPAEVVQLQSMYKQLETEFQKYQKRMEESLRLSLDQNYTVSDKLRVVQQKAQVLQKSTLHLQQQLLCKYCNKELAEAITVIPCAHSYCRGCTKGYTKNCFICGDETKIEATYFNQFMVQMVEMFKTFQTILKLIS